MNTLNIITWYPIDDETFDCEYWKVTLELNGYQIKEWGDYYHDKGDIKAEVFVEGMQYQSNNGFVVTQENKHLSEEESY